MSTTFLEHLGLSVAQIDPIERRAWLLSFDGDAPDAWTAHHFVLDRSPRTVLDVVGRCLALDGFQLGAGVDYARGQVAGLLIGDYAITERVFDRIPAPLPSHLRLTFKVAVTVEPGVTGDASVLSLNVSRYLPSWTAAFTTRLEQELARTPLPRAPGQPLFNPVVGPGEPPPGPYIGELRDYSRCAVQRDLEDLEWHPELDSLALPLGVYAFDGRPLEKPNQLLYLNRSHTGAPLAYNGVLVVAPQNSGKTELIVRWAIAANAAGNNLLIVDVKGNLYERLMREGLQGRIRHFSTDPKPPRAGIDRHSLNLLHGFNVATAEDRARIRQLAHALLPIEQASQDDRDYWVLCTQWLTALIMLGKQVAYYQEDGSDLDLSQIYRLVSEEELVYQWINFVRAQEEYRRGQERLDIIEPGVDYWVTELALLLDPARIEGGQREAAMTYQRRVSGLKLALDPFSRAGTLYDRIRGAGDFALDELGGDEQVTIILAAREQDLDASRTVVSVAIKRLEQILMERHEVPNPARKILLLLDETRRIRGFNAGDYITFARSAKAGCVLVYQSISQIRDEHERDAILENVGTQIYLGSLIGETARRFVSILPQKPRVVYSSSVSSANEGPNGDSTSTQRSQEMTSVDDLLDPLLQPKL